MSEKERRDLAFEVEEDQTVGEWWSVDFDVVEEGDQAGATEQSLDMAQDQPDETEPEKGSDELEQTPADRSMNKEPVDKPEQDTSVEPQIDDAEAGEPIQDEELAQESGDKKKIKFNAKPLRDHGHMRHGPFQGADVGEESGALMCNFVWSLTKGGGRRLGGLMAAVPRYGASHLAAFLKSRLTGRDGAEAGEEALAEGEFAAKEGERLAAPEDFVKLNIEPDVVERFNAVLADRNIDSLQIANPDGSVKFIVRAQDVDALTRALDDIIGTPDHELDAQHEIAEQARTFSKDSGREEPKQKDATVDMAALGALAQDELTLDELIDEGRKDAAQRETERKQEQAQEKAGERGQGRDTAEKGRSRQRDRGADPDR